MLCFDPEALSSVLRRLGEGDVIKDGPLLLTRGLDDSFAASALTGESVWKTKFLEFRGALGLRSDRAASF